MEMQVGSQREQTSWWIISLAISVVCCAILFVIFAGMFFSAKKDLNDEHVSIAILEQRLMNMSGDLEYLKRHSMPQQIQILSGGQPIQVPDAVMGAVSKTQELENSASVTHGSMPPSTSTSIGSKAPVILTPPAPIKSQGK